MKRTLFQLGLSALMVVGTISNLSAQWVKKSDNLQFQVGRWGGMSAVVGGKIYLTGGYANMQWLNDLQEYDPATGAWKNLITTPVGPLNRSAGVAFTINGKMYLGLGAENFLSISGSQKNLKDLWEFTPSTGAWVQKASLPDSGRTESSVFVANNKAYIVGGAGFFGAGKSATNQVWEYDAATNKWTKKADYPETSIENAAAFAINNKGYISGGQVGTTNTAKTYEYNPTANTWTPKADFPDLARYGAVSFVVDNKGFVGLGGTSYTDYKSTFFYYNPATDSWSGLFSNWTATPRLYGVAAVVGNKAYAGCGWRLDGTTQSYFRDWYEMDIVAKLSIDNTAGTNRFVVYPNPSIGVLHIDAESGNYNYNVYNMTGQKSASGLLGVDKTINLSDLAQGQYILELVSEKQTYRAIIFLSK